KQRLRELLSAQPDATLAELGARMDRSFRTSTIDLWLRRLGWKFKKNSGGRSARDISVQDADRRRPPGRSLLPLVVWWPDERRDVFGLGPARIGPHATARRRGDPGQPGDAQNPGSSRLPRSGRRAVVVPAALFAGLQPDRTNVEQDQTGPAQPRSAHRRRTAAGGPGRL